MAFCPQIQSSAMDKADCWPHVEFEASLAKTVASPVFALPLGLFHGVLTSDDEYYQRVKHFVPPDGYHELCVALQRASGEGNLSAVKVALSAAQKALTEPLRLAREQGRVEVGDNIYGSTLARAIDAQDEDVVAFLLSHRVPARHSEVTHAIKVRNTAILQLLFEVLDMNSSLCHAVHLPTSLGYAIEDAELTAWFLAHGADPNATSYGGVSPLSWAVERGPFAVVEMLFAHGGDANKGQLLHHAIWRQLDDRNAMVEYLLRKGAPVNAVMYDDDQIAYCCMGFFGQGTPLQTAARDGKEDILRLLVKHGARISIRDHKGELAADKAERAGHTGAAQYLRGLQAVQGLSKL